MTADAGLAGDRPRRRSYCWRPFIGFEDTNLVGNVYFAHFVSWQGRCREAFLAERAPDVLAALAADLRLVTLNVSCEFYEELRAFDEVTLEMSLASRQGHRLGLSFDYRLQRDGMSRLAARGTQEVACMRIEGEGRLVPADLPESLAAALQAYA
ncbi:MAG TPA: acyl-CoA thioesterase [Allosphingosinicella sp.]|nr:acyl-CoA thioesterase [Allosphingosinicella sp.]